MELPAAQSSKKRVFPGGSSSYNDPDIVEIAPPISWSSNSKAKSIKQKEGTHREVVYIDSDDDLGDVVVIDEEAPVSSKGKQPANISQKNIAASNAVDGHYLNLYLGNASQHSQNDANEIGSSLFLGENWVPTSSLSLWTPGEVFGANVAANLAQISTAPQVFKQFDTVDDYSDHYYYKNGRSFEQQPKNWAKRIQEEWKSLEKDLPDTIFVRVYETRMDLMRAAIIGAQGTPYHDGLFFFDVFFPSAYPSIPPHVYYHSGGLRINPNLYDCGKVCLSLLNTWSGSANEKWIPNVSTMLQVLVSIQALILNEKPYFNEPGWAGSAGSATGERNSKKYSEDVFLLSLKTMVYTMRKPPMHYYEIVVGHFCERAQYILKACEAYIEKGVPVGSFTIEAVQEVKRKGRKKKCALDFQSNLASHIKMLVEALIQIGAKDCEKFLPLAEKGK